LKVLRILFTAFLVLAVLGGCTSAPSKFVLGVSSNRFSDIERCGCSAQDLGGIDREVNLLEQYKSERNLSVTYLVTGTTLVTQPQNFKPSRIKRYLSKAGYVVEALNLMGASYYAPSIQDLSLGVDAIRGLEQKAKFKFLSANLFQLKDGKMQASLFKPYEEVNLAGAQVLFIGLSGKGNPVYKVDSMVGFKPPKEALKAVFEKVDPTGKFVVLLSSLPEVELKEVQAEFPQIQFYAGGSDQRATLDLEYPSRKTVYGNPSARGRDVLIVEVGAKLPFDEFYSEKGAQFATERKVLLDDQLRKLPEKIANAKTPAEKAEHLERQKKYEVYFKDLEKYAVNKSRKATELVSFPTTVSGRFAVKQNPANEILTRLKKAGLSEEGSP